jgi:outer membrane protein OmpA-like peptidoglycan-associated protein
VRAENGVFYSSDEKQFETLDESKVVELEMTLTSQDCPEDDLGCILDLEPIYFDLNKATIRPDAEIELNKVLDALRRYPNLNIHIESHTDSRARDAYNLDLSNRRAQSTMVWLLKRGISSGRLTAMGYGESRLLNRCSNGVNCSEYEHELNRRSVFRIVANDLEKLRVQSDLNRSVIVNNSPENISDQTSDLVTDQVTEVLPTVSSENIDKPKSNDSVELIETPIAQVIDTTDDIKDKEQSETIKKNESVNVQPSDNYDFSSSNTKVIYTVQISAHKGNNKTLKFNKIDGVFSNYYDDNYKRYFSGVFNNENEARLHQKSIVIKGFKDCYVVRLKGNKKL